MWFNELLERFDRIAVALETIAKIEHPLGKVDTSISLIESEEVEDEDFVKLRDEARSLLEKNPTNQVWAEDGLDEDQLEAIE